jgi:hypothetical protein
MRTVDGEKNRFWQRIPTIKMLKIIAKYDTIDPRTYTGLRWLISKKSQKGIISALFAITVK